MSDLDVLLAGIVCTQPWTLDDSRALYAMLKLAVPHGAHVDINCPRGDKVFVSVGDLKRVYDVV